MIELPMATYYANNKTEHISLKFEPLIAQSCLTLTLNWKNDALHPYIMTDEGDQ
jgi:hypothetical protein